MLSFPLIENSTAEKILAAFFDKSGQFPNALLLWGPDGTGKRTAANFLAAGLVCSERQCPCGVCDDCRRAIARVHQDILVLEREKTYYKIDDVRAFVAQAYTAPGQADCKVMMIPDAQLLRPESQDVLLKTLEEPPAGVYFILTATSPAALLPTVVSRVVQVEIDTVSDSGVEKILQKQFPDGAQDDIRMAVVCGGGSVGQAVSLMGEGDFSQICGLTLAVERAVSEKDDGKLMIALSQVRDTNRDKNRRMLMAFTTFSTALLLRRLRGDMSFFSGLGCAQVVCMVRLMEDARTYLAANVNTKLFLMGLHRKISAAMDS